MKRHVMAVGLALIALAGCKDGGSGNDAAPTKAAAKAAGDETIAKGFDSAAADTKFVTAIKASGLAPTLAGPGPYTVLVPDDNAFAKLPAGALDELMVADGKKRLVKLISFHILPGTMLSSDIADAIDRHGGKALLITMEGGTLTATRSDGKIILTDSAGARALVAVADEKRSNGVVHHLDTVLAPKS